MLRCEFEGAIYHVMARGIERRAIFKDNADRYRFLDKLQESLARDHIALYAFTLMSNHYICCS